MKSGWGRKRYGVLRRFKPELKLSQSKPICNMLGSPRLQERPITSTHKINPFLPKYVINLSFWYHGIDLQLEKLNDLIKSAHRESRSEDINEAAQYADLVLSLEGVGEVEHRMSRHSCPFYQLIYSAQINLLNIHKGAGPMLTLPHEL